MWFHKNRIFKNIWSFLNSLQYFFCYLIRLEIDDRTILTTWASVSNGTNVRSIHVRSSLWPLSLPIIINFPQLSSQTIFFGAFFPPSSPRSPYTTRIFTTYYYPLDRVFWQFSVFLLSLFLGSGTFKSMVFTRLSSVTLVSQHYYNTMTMTLVSWCCNTIATLYQIWCQWKWGINLENHQFWSKLEKSSCFWWSKFEKSSFLPNFGKIIIFPKFEKPSFFSKIGKNQQLWPKYEKSSFLAKFWKSPIINSYKI